jgi:hypothetical protein
MLRLLCQVCGGPADQMDNGVLWLLRDHRGGWRVRCVAVSLKLCPALRRGTVAVRVRELPIAGVRAAFYRRGVFAPVAVEAVHLSYADSAVRWIVASALIRELHDCIAVPIAELVAAQA